MRFIKYLYIFILLAVQYSFQENSSENNLSLETLILLRGTKKSSNEKKSTLPNPLQELGTEETETEELPYSGSRKGMNVDEENVLESSLNVEQQIPEVKESVDQLDQNSEKIVYNEEESDRTEELPQVESESPDVPEIIKEPDTYYDEELSNDEKNNLPNEL